MKIPMHPFEGNGHHTRSPSISARQDSGNMSHGTQGLIIFAVILGFFLCGGLVLAFVLRFLRTRHANPTYLPGSWLKSKWRAWVPSSEKKRYSSSLQDRWSVQMPSSSIANGLNGSRGPSRNGDGNDDADVPDRHTSVRSTITLPAYSAAARPTEQTLGREGERAGIDTVVEFPETVDEEEARRDEEMETLYQIRRARREERSARDERRQLRQVARGRGDMATLAELRREEMGNARPSAALIQDHQMRDRGRRVPTVQYLDLGLARHDGSRVRANSNDSDRSLLGAAATMGRVNETRARSHSGTLNALLGNNSVSSLRINAADYSDDEATSDLEPSSLNRSSRTPSPSRLGGLAAIDTDLESQPPSYDRLSVWSRAPIEMPRPLEPAATVPPPQGPAPPYETPVLSGAPRLAPFAPLPSIEITPTPWTPPMGQRDARAQ